MPPGLDALRQALAEPRAVNGYVRQDQSTERRKHRVTIVGHFSPADEAAVFAADASCLADRRNGFAVVTMHNDTNEAGG
jgi:hypothetical protein